MHLIAIKIVIFLVLEGWLALTTVILWLFLHRCQSRVFTYPMPTSTFGIPHMMNPTDVNDPLTFFQHQHEVETVLSEMSLKHCHEGYSALMYGQYTP